MAKRDHMKEGAAAVEKYVNMLELLTEVAAEACHAAAEKGSADKKAIGEQVDNLLAGITACATVGSMLIASLTATRIALDRANEQLANLNTLDKIESAEVGQDVLDMVGTALAKAALKKE